MKEQDSQAPQAPRSGAAAEGPIEVTPSPAGAEGRQSPGLEEAREHLKTMAVHYDDDTYDQELFDAAVAYAKALATPSQEEGPAGQPSTQGPASRREFLEWLEAVDPNMEPSRRHLAWLGWCAGRARLRAQAPASSPRAADLEGGRILQRDMRCPRGHSDVRYTYASDTHGTIWCEECGAKHEMAFDGKIIGNALYRAWLAAHPPEDTPIEAAGDLEAAVDAFGDAVEALTKAEYRSGSDREIRPYKEAYYEARAKILEWGHLATRPGTPIEKAAREYVEARRESCKFRQEDASEAAVNAEAAEDGAWSNLCVAVDGWKPDARASLSGLPQETSSPDLDLEDLRKVLECVVQNGEDPCYFDHHGYCQAHGWMSTEECYVKTAQRLLESLPPEPEGAQEPKEGGAA